MQSQSIKRILNQYGVNVDNAESIVLLVIFFVWDFLFLFGISFFC